MSYLEGIPYQLSAIAFEVVDVEGTAIGLTIPSGAIAAQVYVGVAAAVMKMNGEVPTAEEGIPLGVGSIVILHGDTMKKALFIRLTGDSAELSVHFFGRG